MQGSVAVAVAWTSLHTWEYQSRRNGSHFVVAEVVAAVVGGMAYHPWERRTYQPCWDPLAFAGSRRVWSGNEIRRRAFWQGTRSSERNASEALESDSITRG